MLVCHLGFLTFSKTSKKTVQNKGAHIFASGPQASSITAIWRNHYDDGGDDHEGNYDEDDDDNSNNNSL